MVLLNVEKTVRITFANYIDSIPSTFNLKLNDQKIRKVDHVKYLGVLVDQYLKWDYGIQAKKKEIEVYCFCV